MYPHFQLATGNFAMYAVRHMSENRGGKYKDMESIGINQTEALQRKLEGIITRKCELRRELDDLARKQAELNIQIFKNKANELEGVNEEVLSL